MLRTLVAVVVAVIAATLPAAGAEPSLVLTASHDTALVGEIVRLDARGVPGARVEVDGQSALLDAAGLASFPITRATAGVYAIEGASGAARATLALTWVEPLLLVEVASSAPIHTRPLLLARAFWGANLTPAVGVQLGVDDGDALVATGATDASGLFESLLPSAPPGARGYTLAADDALFARAATHFGLVWIDPVVPAPPQPPPIHVPASSNPANTPPALGAVSIALAAGRATAIVEGASDADGDPVLLAFHWTVDGAAFEGPSVAAPAGARLRLVVIAADARGGTDTRVVDLIVPADLPPIARFLVNGPRFADAPLVFDATASIDPEGGSLSYAWRFSDGASAEGPRVERAFPAGGAWAILRVEDAAGQAHETRVDLTLAPEPAENASTFRAVDGEEHDLPTDASIERVLSAGPAPSLLLQTPEGPVLWEGGAVTRLAARDAELGGARYQPRVVSTRAATGAEDGRPVLVRLRDPQPGLPLLGVFADGQAQAWWRDGADIVVVTRSGQLDVSHQLPPLELDATLSEGVGAYRISATATGGAPIRSLRVEGPDGVIVDVTERKVEARVAPGEEERRFRVVVETLAGERIERELVLPAQPVTVPIEPAADAGGAAAARVPWPGLLALLAAAGAARLRKRS